MWWIRKSSTTSIVTLFAVLAMLASFPVGGIEFLSTALSFPEGEDGLFQLVYHLPENVGEQAVVKKADDSDASTLRIANQRFFNLSGPIDSGNTPYLSYFQSHSTKKIVNNKGVIFVKLRI